MGIFIMNIVFLGMPRSKIFYQEEIWVKKIMGSSNIVVDNGEPWSQKGWNPLNLMTSNLIDVY